MKVIGPLSENAFTRFVNSNLSLKVCRLRICQMLFVFSCTLLAFRANATNGAYKPVSILPAPSAQMVMADTIQKEFLITRNTTKKQLLAIQQSLSDNNYSFTVESEVFNNNELVLIAGHMKFKLSSGNGWSFDISNFESIKITINMNNEIGTFQMDTVKPKVKKQVRL